MLLQRFLPSQLSVKRAEPLSGNHRMAALLILFLLADGVADRNGRNQKRDNPHDRGEHIRVSHRAIPPLHSLCMRGMKSQAPSVVLQAMEPFTTPLLLYHVRLCRSIPSNNFSICSALPLRSHAITAIIAPEATSPRRHPGTRKDLTGSNLWPVRSGCIDTIPIRTIVQTRAALKRRGVGLHARSGVEAVTARRVACAKRCGRRHCRLTSAWRLLLCWGRRGGQSWLRACRGCAEPPARRA